MVASIYPESFLVIRTIYAMMYSVPYCVFKTTVLTNLLPFNQVGL
ncbi:TPA: hypothetical protein ACPJ1I_004302 [Vibrio diabolicus]